MLFRWLRSRRRRKLLASPADPAWQAYLRAHVRQYAGMDDATQSRLLDRARIIVAEKHWEGCAGLVLTDEIRLAIAGNAALLLVGVEGYYFDGLQTILVYPDTYVHPAEFQQRRGIAFGDVAVEGESWPGGPMVLSWQNILDDAARTRGRRNLVVHEFAHVLDRLDGTTDGIPPWTSRALQQRWKQVARRAYRELSADYNAARPLWLDPYALTNKAEFFAVANECFFQRPDLFQQRQPAMFELLCQFYRVDPRQWQAAGTEPSSGDM